MRERKNHGLTTYELQIQLQNRYFEKSLRALTLEITSAVISACALYAMYENLASEPVTKGVVVVSGIVSSISGVLGINYSRKSH